MRQYSNSFLNLFFKWFMNDTEIYRLTPEAYQRKKHLIKTEIFFIYLIN